VRPGAPSFGAGQVLRLQRLAGNGAVAAALQRGSGSTVALQRSCGCAGGGCACDGSDPLAVQAEPVPAPPGADPAASADVGSAVTTAPGATDSGSAVTAASGLADSGSAVTGGSGLDSGGAVTGTSGDAGAGDDCGATRCGAPASCPPPFCCPFPLGTARIIAANIQIPFLAAIGAKVTPSVVPVWLTWFNGGAALSDFTPKFGSDFTNDPTTKDVSANLATALPGQLDQGRLQALAAGSPGVDVSLLPALPPSHLATTSASLEAFGPNQMDFNTIGTAPGNLAGGIGKNEAACPVGAKPSTVDDARVLTDVRGTLTPNPNGSVTVVPTFRYKVTDTVDLCPGNCGSDLGLINEQQATIPMSRLEASGVSGDVPFTVDFPSTPQAAFTVASPAPPAPQDVTLSASSLFDFGSDVLRPDAEAALVAQLGDRPAQADLTQPFVIEGHTDSKGSDAFNIGLSQRRAQRVASALERRFPNLVGHLTVTGLGKANPVAPNNLPDGSDNPDGRRLNRRVELHFSAPPP